MRFVLAVTALLACGSDAGEAPTPCSTPTEDWVSRVDGQWSSDCSKWDAPQGTHLCVVAALDDCHDCTSGLAFSADPVAVVEGANLASAEERFGELEIDFEDATDLVEFDVAVGCDAGTRGSFHVRGDLTEEEPTFSWQ